MNAPERLPVPAEPDTKALAAFSETAWNARILPQLKDYVAIPAKSPMFDADWEKHGLLDKVVRDAAQWVEGRKVPGLTLEILRQPGRTPVIFFEIPATRASSFGTPPTVVMYGWTTCTPPRSIRSRNSQRVVVCSPAAIRIGERAAR